MAGILGKIFGKAGEGILSGAEKILDTVITSDEERAQAKYKMRALVEKYKAKAMNEVSQRHKYDMKSDSWLSKNIRPMLLVYTMVVISVYAFVDGADLGVDIPEGYIDLMGQALIAMIGFYFGGRTFEKQKAMSSMRDMKKERERTMQKAMDNKVDLKEADLPKVSLSDDNE